MQSFSFKKKAPLIVFLLFVFSGLAQVGTRNGVSVLEGVSVPSEHVRDDDVVWMKTIWQEIDLREKMNHPLYFPEDPSQNRKSLFDYIKESLMNESGLVAYSPGALGFDDMFTEVLSRDSLEKILFREQVLETPDLWTDTMIKVKFVNDLQTENILGYEIKEHWFIDKERSVLNVRIVGLCPLEAVYDDDGSFRGKRRLFWIYYPDAKMHMATWPYYIRSNDLQYISFDDVFTQRRFSSHIVKASNVYDRTLNEYLPPMEALLEGEHQKELIREIELDMRNY